jgi:hypothetical protein
MCGLCINNTTGSKPAKTLFIYTRNIFDVYQIIIFQADKIFFIKHSFI